MTFTALLGAAFEVKNEWCLQGDTPCETVIAAFRYFRIIYSVVALPLFTDRALS